MGRGRERDIFLIYEWQWWLDGEIDNRCGKIYIIGVDGEIDKTRMLLSQGGSVGARLREHVFVAPGHGTKVKIESLELLDGFWFFRLTVWLPCSDSLKNLESGQELCQTLSRRA